jgi:hypothetical protein
MQPMIRSVSPIFPTWTFRKGSALWTALFFWLQLKLPIALDASTRVAKIESQNRPNGQHLDPLINRMRGRDVAVGEVLLNRETCRGVDADGKLVLRDVRATPHVRCDLGTS